MGNDQIYRIQFFYQQAQSSHEHGTFLVMAPHFDAAVTLANVHINSVYSSAVQKGVLGVEHLGEIAIGGTIAG